MQSVKQDQFSPRPEGVQMCLSLQLNSSLSHSLIGSGDILQLKLRTRQKTIHDSLD